MEKTKKKKMKKSTKFKILLFMLLSLFVALTALLMLLVPGRKFAGNFPLMVKNTFVSKEKAGYPYLSDEFEILAVKKIGSGIGILDENELCVLNAKGSQLMQIKHGFSGPVLETAWGKAILYDRQSGRMKVMGPYGVLFEEDYSKNILAVALGRKNNLAVASKLPGQSALLEVFDKNGNKIFTQDFENDRITSVALSEDGKSVAVALLGSKDAQLYSNLVIYDFNQEETAGFFTYPETLIFKVSYCKNKKIALVGDNYLGYIKTRGKEKMTPEHEYTYATGSIRDYAVSERGRVTLLLEEIGDANKNFLKAYDYEGKLKFEEKLEQKARAVSCDENYCSVLSDDNLISFSEKGKRVGEHKLTKFAQRPVSVGRYTLGVEKKSVTRIQTQGFENKTGKNTNK